jgi:hypothetical protein
MLFANETHFFTAPNHELFESADVVDQQIHETKLVAESHQDVETRWVQCNAVRFLCKHLVQFQVAGKKAHKYNDRKKNLTL